MRYALLALLALSACAGTDFDKQSLTSFLPVSETKFVYKAVTDLNYPLDKQGEKIRVAWMEEYLRDMGMCQQGYAVVDRRVIIKTKGLFADVGDVIYRGECKA